MNGWELNLKPFDIDLKPLNIELIPLSEPILDGILIVERV